ncbi:conserved Plasmodium protein, unknown function [Plasmodium ovale]|uniref:Uncharacterized protein n=1 Tax=Plasmodium ovale TaxID=36330 RepID=A0A1C3KVG0_PLAOA|nr:conserved Plasmodium protein, unknown function [Plasmodium ovale]
MIRSIFALHSYLLPTKRGGISRKNFLYVQNMLICNQQTPLHIYNATKYSKKSMNHRLFYINWMFVFLFLDFCNDHFDI